MELLPLPALAELLERRAAAFALLHGYLDAAVQDAFARWVDKYPDPLRLHGAVLASTVRALTLRALDSAEFRSSGLSVARGPNCSVVLSEPEGPRVRVRRHPRVLRTGQLLPVTQPPVQTLFGTDPGAAPWETFVLWHPDLRTQSLREAGLAAVAHIDRQGKRLLYGKLALPPAPTALGAPPRDETIAGTGFDDLFPPGEEGAGGADPA